MNKTFEVERTIIYDCKRTSYYTVNVDEYEKWLDGEDPNDDNLRVYLEELDPDDEDEDYDEVEDIVEADELFEAMNYDDTSN